MEETGPRVVEGGPLRFLLSVPPGPAPGAGWPVLCFLHGHDEAAPMEIRRALTLHGPLRPGSSRRARSGFVVVAPQLPLGGDVWHRHADEVREIVAWVRRAHRGDPRRTYLTGFSYGGSGVFDLALAQPDTWAALWPVDPTRVPQEDPGRPVWLSFGAVARFRKKGFIHGLRLAQPGAGPAGDRIYHDEGADHVGSATLAYAEDRIYDWLLAKELPEAS